MSRTWRWVIGLAVILVAANAVVALLQSKGAAEGTPDFSTYRGGKQGMRAAFNTLGRLGMEPERHEAPLTELPEDTAQLWLINPTQALTHDELVALKRWVYDDGGQLVVGYGDMLSYAAAYLVYMQQPDTSPFPELLEAQPPPMQVAVASVSGALTPEAGAYGFPLTQDGVLRNVRLLYSPRSTAMASMGGFTPMVRSEDGALIAGRTFGEGVILCVGDVDMFSNSGLPEVDNVVLLSNIAGYADGRVLFDEYHHGFTAGPTGPLGLIQRSRAAAVVGALVAGILVILVAVGSRFGRPEEPYVPPRRSQIEYVDSVAQLYQNAIARQVAIGNLYQAAIRRLAGATRFRGEIDHGQLARLASPRVGMSAKEIEDTLNEANGLLDRGCHDDVTLLEVASRLARISRSPRPGAP
ncbi:MAG: hypothetical protein GF320_13160 [Armatimonadia bacterium]|nr:hypothetical protein [Armatimonadia bacterium]